MTAATPRGRRLAAVTGALLALSATVAACGGGEDEERPAAAPPAATEKAEPRGATVEMADLRFEPKSLTVDRGETVTFRNVGKVTHNAKGRTFFSRVVEPGESYRHKFSKAGRYDYLCTFHPGMEGTLTVR